MTDKIQEISINQYYESLKFAQQYLFAGILVSAIAFVSIIHREPNGKLTIPYINLEISDFNFYQQLIFAIYFISGCMSFIGVKRATTNIRHIENKQIYSLLLQFPNIFLSGVFIKSILYGGFFLISIKLCSYILPSSELINYILGIFFALPYFLSLSKASELKK